MSIIPAIFQYNQTWDERMFRWIRFVELVVITQVIIYAWGWGLYVRHLETVVRPLGLANYIDVRIFFHHQFSLLLAFFITTTALMGYYRKVRWSYLVSLILMHIMYVTRFSQGKAGHGANFIGMGLFCFAIALLLYKSEKDRIKTAWGLLIFFIGLSYTLASLSKLAGTGFHWPDGPHLWLWMHQLAIDHLSENGHFTFSRFQLFILQHRDFATFILASGWITEFFGFLYWFRKIRPIMATLLLGLHLGIFFSMNINFLDSFALMMVLAGYPWQMMLKYGKRKTEAVESG